MKEIMNRVMWSVWLITSVSLSVFAMDEEPYVEKTLGGMHVDETMLSVTDPEKPGLMAAEVRLQGYERRFKDLSEEIFVAKVVNFLLRHMTVAQVLQSGNPGYAEFWNEPRNMSLFSWVGNILRMSKMRRFVMVLALMNLKILLQRYPDIHMTTNCVRRMFFAACIITSKAWHDSCDEVYRNRFWANIFGDVFTLQQVNRYEREMLDYFHWQVLPCFVRPLAASMASFLYVQYRESKMVDLEIDGAMMSVKEKAYWGERHSDVLPKTDFDYPTIESFFDQFFLEQGQLEVCRFEEKNEKVPGCLLIPSGAKIPQVVIST